MPADNPRPSRRAFLGAAASALAGLSLPDIARLRADSSDAKDTSVIFVWLPGGPPHMETYDLKPDAPAEYRGEFKPVRTNVPGLDVCELLPLHAKMADRFSLIRSVHHGFSDHGGGHKHFLTGYEPREPVGFVNDHPMVGSVVARCREGRRAGVPDYVAGTDTNRSGIDVFSFGSAYLGPSSHPFPVVGDPSEPGFRVRNLALNPAVADRMDDRAGLLAGLDRARRDADARGTMDSMDEFGRRAVELLTSPKAREAFDLSREPDAVRDRYGRHRWGQRALLARRLVEAGSSWVTMVFENPMPPGQALPENTTYNWDSHAVNCHVFEDCRLRLPYLDQAVTALIEDLYVRGLDRRTLLVVTGEFGRTPRISYAKGRPGRDHWPQAMSMLVSGGGLRMGQVVGSTDAKGERPKDRPLTPCDLWATVYHHLGIDPERTFPDHNGRPMPLLPHGSPIRELVG